MNILVSIIIPSYNTETTIRRCLDSILSQSYPVFEVIVVDDGSNDGSGLICDQYAIQDSRIHCIHTENKGVASARNTGLAEAHGDCVCFVDGDDYVMPDYLCNMLKIAEPEVDLVFSYCINVRDGVAEIPSCRAIKLVDDHLGDLFSFNKNITMTNPWSKLFRLRIIRENNLIFPEGVQIGEDAVFLFRYLQKCKCVVLTDDHDYVYNITSQGSLTKAIYNVDTEIRIRNLIVDCIEKYIDSIHCNETSLNELDRLKRSYLVRILDSLYFSEHYDRTERLSQIRDLPFDELRNFPIRGSIRAKLLAMLLRCGFIRTYDSVRIIAKKLLR